MIQYGDTSDLDAWEVNTLFGVRTPIGIVISGDQITLELSLAAPILGLQFFGPPPYFVSRNRATLEAFNTPVPVP